MRAGAGGRSLGQPRASSGPPMHGFGTLSGSGVLRHTAPVVGPTEVTKAVSAGKGIAVGPPTAQHWMVMHARLGERGGPQGRCLCPARLNHSTRDG